METSEKQILVDNFKECVRQCQQCILWTIGASFSSLLFALQMRVIGAAGLKQGQGAIEILFGHLPLFGAWLLAFGIYVILGSYATYTAGQAARNADRLAPKGSGDRQTLTDLMLYPSLVTSRNPLLRLGGIVLALGLMILSWIIEIVREKGNGSWKDQPWMLMIAAAVLLLLPYIFLFQKLRRLSFTLMAEKDEKKEDKKRAGA
jgi:hypothetical protein